MERIVQGESGNDLRGTVAVVNKPAGIPVNAVGQEPGMYSFDSSYPRAGTVNSLHYHNAIERSGAYKAPGGGRGSVLFIESTSDAAARVLAEQELLQIENENGAPPHEPVETQKQQDSRLQQLATPRQRIVMISARQKASGSRGSMMKQFPMQVQRSNKGDAYKNEGGAPLQHAGPPRSGKSIFYAQGSRPQVLQSERNPVPKLTPGLERMVRGEPSQDPEGLIPYLHEAPEIAVRQVDHVPALEVIDSAYPRHGTENSLQYHEPVERAGAHMAPEPGRGSISTSMSATLMDEAGVAGVVN